MKGKMTAIDFFLKHFLKLNFKGKCNTTLNVYSYSPPHHLIQQESKDQGGQERESDKVYQLLAYWTKYTD